MVLCLFPVLVQFFQLAALDFFAFFRYLFLDVMKAFYEPPHRAGQSHLRISVQQPGEVDNGEKRITDFLSCCLQSPSCMAFFISSSSS